MLGSIIDAITSIGDKIVSLASGIVDGIGNLLKSLFIPKDNYFTDIFTRLKDKVSSKLGFATYIQLFDALKSMVTNSPTFGGYIDVSMWVKYLPQIHSYIKGFFYALMVIFNIKMLLWLIRGTSPIGGGDGK